MRVVTLVEMITASTGARLKRVRLSCAFVTLLMRDTHWKMRAQNNNAEFLSECERSGVSTGDSVQLNPQSQSWLNAK